jgi:hypothetical protein
MPDVVVGLPLDIRAHLVEIKILLAKFVKDPKATGIKRRKTSKYPSTPAGPKNCINDS